MGFEVTAAADGSTAIRSIMGTNLDIVISDLSMPGEDGFAVLKAVSLWIYPLSQTKVNKIESELATRRVAAIPETRPA